MSTQEEIQSPPPDPVDTIVNFRNAHEQLLQRVQLGMEFPSQEILGLISTDIRAAGSSMDPFFQTVFFRERGEELAVAEALGAVRDVLINIVDYTKQLDPEARIFVEFEHDEIERYTDRILNGDLDDAEHLALQLCEAHTQLINNFEAVAINSGGIARFIESETRAALRKQQLIDTAKQFGMLATAGMIGGLVATQLSKRLK
jgi:hypothetical protein